MRILAFDTATPATTVALDAGDLVREARDDPPPGQRPRHATKLLPLVSELLEESDVGWEAIDRIAVGVGPGTFTGLRIGIATAQALGRAAAIPLVAVSTLHSLALGAQPPSPADGLVAAVLDARRGEVYAAAWDLGRLDEGGEPVLQAQALRPDALAAMLRQMGSSVLGIGDGAVAFREVLEGSGVSVPEDASELHRVTAARHCQIARRLPTVDPDRIRPDYQRPPDARPRPSIAARPAPRDGH